MGGLDLVVAMGVIGAVIYSLLADPAGRRRRPGSVLRQGPAAAAGRPAASAAIRPRPPLAPPPPGTPGRPWSARRRSSPFPPGFEVEGRLLFADRTGPRHLALDCLLGGSPVRLAARCGMTWWACDRLTRLVERWASEDRPATVRVVMRSGGLRAVVASGDTSLVLDVVEAGELASQLAADKESRTRLT